MKWFFLAVYLCLFLVGLVTSITDAKSRSRAEVTADASHVQYYMVDVIWPTYEANGKAIVVTELR